MNFNANREFKFFNDKIEKMTEKKKMTKIDENDMNDNKTENESQC